MDTKHWKQYLKCLKCNNSFDSKVNFKKHTNKEHRSEKKEKEIIVHKSEKKIAN